MSIRSMDHGVCCVIHATLLIQDLMQFIMATLHSRCRHYIFVQDLMQFIMATLLSRCGHYIFVLWFLLSSFFSSPNLSGRRLDVYHTSTHGVALVHLECRSEMCCARFAGNTGHKKSPFWHHHTTLSGYVFGTKALAHILVSKSSELCKYIIFSLNS